MFAEKGLFSLTFRAFLLELTVPIKIVAQIIVTSAPESDVTSSVGRTVSSSGVK